MTSRMRDRIIAYAQANRHRPIWKRRLFAALYGASIPKLARIRP
jgi:hypothetical protein